MEKYYIVLVLLLFAILRITNGVSYHQRVCGRASYWISEFKGSPDAFSVHLTKFLITIHNTSVHMEFMADTAGS